MKYNITQDQLDKIINGIKSYNTVLPMQESDVFVTSLFPLPLSTKPTAFTMALVSQDRGIWTYVGEIDYHVEGNKNEE